ncbi:unnamed protein product [Albugo candida]|uniref:Uncharacterized protein n=1 Tax=Albugo candida TaxID=65357 RepID=A0A024G2R3_9STRA|nr:unnamed protein product [Albugo candida]|eukprot:CCI41060.1 unnamed protein product [Albugo candida]
MASPFSFLGEITHNDLWIFWKNVFRSSTFFERRIPCTDLDTCTRLTTAKNLVSADNHSNTHNHKFTYSIETAPVYIDDLVVLPMKVARSLG